MFVRPTGPAVSIQGPVCALDATTVRLFLPGTTSNPMPFIPLEFGTIASYPKYSFGRLRVHADVAIGIGVFQSGTRAFSKGSAARERTFWLALRYGRTPLSGSIRLFLEILCYTPLRS